MIQVGRPLAVHRLPPDTSSMPYISSLIDVGAQVMLMIIYMVAARFGDHVVMKSW